MSFISLGVLPILASFVFFELLSLSSILVCNHSLGLEDGTLPDNQMTASSSFNQWRKAHKARLNKNGFWSPKTSGSDAWLQIEFKKSTNITAVATQGRGSGYSFVQKYFLEFFQEPGSSWEEYAPGGTRKVADVALVSGSTCDRIFRLR